MRYYTIQNNGLLIAENKQALERFYNNVLPLPDDYEQGKYIVANNELVLNPDFEEEKERQEQDRIDRLTMTALDLITAVKLFGVTDKQVEDFLNANLDIKHQLQFCQNVYCGVVKSFCPITIGEVEITTEVVEQLFKNKNDNQQV